MIRKKPAPDLIRGGNRFSEKIMLQQKPRGGDHLSRSGSTRKISTPRMTIVKRKAASWPFQLRDCHMARYSPATTKKPKNQTPKPTVKPATAQTFARLKASAVAPSRATSANAPAVSSRQVRPSVAMIVA